MGNLSNQKIYGVVVVALLFFTSLFASNPSIASAVEHPELTIIETYKFNGEENTVTTLENGHSVKVENSEHSQVSINNEPINKIDYGYIERVTNFQKEDDLYLLIEYRYHGSGSILFFNIIKMNDKSADVIYQSNEYPRGKITISDTNLELVTPEYTDSDSLATPSYVNVSNIEVNSANVKETSATKFSVNEYNLENKQERNEFQILSTPVNSNPPASEINRILTEKALANNIPPEVLKAIAWQESRWRQFNSDGTALIGFDGRGIGILQVTPGVTGIPEIDSNINDAVERLKTDIEYNIDMGIRILLQKWRWTGTILPTVNDGSWQVIDNWYFAIIAYNGISKINDPNLNTNASYPPFQHHIYNHMRNRGLLSIVEIPKEELDIFYLDNDPVISRRNVMRFSNKMQYDLFGPMTRTKHLFRAGDKVRTTTNSLNVRTSPGGTIIATIPRGEVITIIGNFRYQNNINNHYVWYPVRYMDGDVERTGFVASSYLVDVEQRLFGQTRHETAVLISQQGWNTAGTVVLARGDDFPDALAGAPLAHMLNAPMLLTRTDRLTPMTKREILRLGARKAVILGGELAVSANVVNELRAMGLEIERISGSTRFETAKLIADRLGEQHQEAIVINVNAFADAMAIAPYAARNRVPIVLTNRTSIPSSTQTVLNRTANTIVIGGDLVISNEVVSQLPNVTKQFNGKTRFHTAEQIARELHPRRNNAFVVSGMDFPDGLTGAVLAAANIGDSIVLTSRDTLPAVTKGLISEFTNVTVVGGPLAISDDVVMQIQNR